VIFDTDSAFPGVSNLLSIDRKVPKYDQPEKLERKNMRNPKGFTLIEAIITAVIIAILATVAIPLYTGYVAGARQDTVNNLAQTAAAAEILIFVKQIRH